MLDNLRKGRRFLLRQVFLPFSQPITVDRIIREYDESYRTRKICLRYMALSESVVIILSHWPRRHWYDASCSLTWLLCCTTCVDSYMSMLGCSIGTIRQACVSYLRKRALAQSNYQCSNSIAIRQDRHSYNFFSPFNSIYFYPYIQIFLLYRIIKDLFLILFTNFFRHFFILIFTLIFR